MAKEAPPVASNNKKRKLSNMSFPQILWKMVTETAKTSPDIISWIENGEAFVVHEPSSRKLGSILQKYFQREYMILSVVMWCFVGIIVSDTH